MVFPESIHIFCRVVDNFGDIGVCWRLSRQFAGEYGIDVTLWVDDLASFRRICAEVDPEHDVQRMQGVVVRRWRDRFGPVAPDDIADVVIEGFGCELPSGYIDAMARRSRKPAWINLEYLSAESWVDGCHAMQSLYPSLPLTKYFFFPGFSDKTGGLLMERDLIARRTAFQGDPEAVAGFLKNIGMNVFGDICKISLFCYPSAPLDALFDALQSGIRPAVCLVPQGVASDAVGAFLQQPALPGASATRGGLTVQVVPFLDQPDYDKLLWACDLNFVRGEDSLVRAQWAARPFIWQIYPQEEGAHQVKLNAFLARHTARMPAGLAQTVTDAWQAWNGGGSAIPWAELRPALPQLTAHMDDWTRHLRLNGDLASNLIEFVRKIG
ncbi:MAG: hypothetical protein JWQ21_3397 [Herminiimonas sp.]|nr:hypothetical protein [Herminiimonas sp.]